MIVLAVALIISLFNTSAAHAERMPLSFVGVMGEGILIDADIAYERKAELVEPILDWKATQ